MVFTLQPQFRLRRPLNAVSSEESQETSSVDSASPDHLLLDLMHHRLTQLCRRPLLLPLQPLLTREPCAGKMEAWEQLSMAVVQLSLLLHLLFNILLLSLTPAIQHIPLWDYQFLFLLHHTDLLHRRHRHLFLLVDFQYHHRLDSLCR